MICEDVFEFEFLEMSTTLSEDCRRLSPTPIVNSCLLEIQGQSIYDHTFRY